MEREEDEVLLDEIREARQQLWRHLLAHPEKRREALARMAQAVRDRAAGNGTEPKEDPA